MTAFRVTFHCFNLTGARTCTAPARVHLATAAATEQMKGIKTVLFSLFEYIRNTAKGKNKTLVQKPKNSFENPIASVLKACSCTRKQHINKKEMSFWNLRANVSSLNFWKCFN